MYGNFEKPYLTTSIYHIQETYSNKNEEKKERKKKVATNRKRKQQQVDDNDDIEDIHPSCRLWVRV